MHAATTKSNTRCCELCGTGAATTTRRAGVVGTMLRAPVRMCWACDVRFGLSDPETVERFDAVGRRAYADARARSKVFFDQLDRRARVAA